MSAWQRWLSPRPPRTDVAHLATASGPEESVSFEWLMVEKNGRAQPVLEAKYDMRHPFNKAGKASPPLHIHLTQNEYFQVIKGSLGFVLDGQKGLLTPDTPPGLIPAGGRHTFWLNPDVDKEEVVFHCWVYPYEVEHGWDATFFRNFQCYLADCARHKMKPSIFQTTLFRYEADLVLTPDFWLPTFLLRAWHHVMAYWIGQRLLGYQSQYPEYAPLKPRGKRIAVAIVPEEKLVSESSSVTDFSAI